ncbi:NVEALA domain-containing protein [Dysgonomonas reticulitermitis]
MKKKIIGGIAILAIAAVAAFNVNLNLAQESNMSPLALANIEALAQSEGGVEKCNILIYNRNNKEQYVTTTVQYNAELGLHAKIGSRIIKLGFGATVGGSVGIPDCVASNGNCCLKSFINNSPKYY